MLWSLNIQSLLKEMWASCPFLLVWASCSQPFFVHYSIFGIFKLCIRYSLSFRSAIAVFSWLWYSSNSTSPVALDSLHLVLAAILHWDAIGLLHSFRLPAFSRPADCFVWGSLHSGSFCYGSYSLRQHDCSVGAFKTIHRVGIIATSNCYFTLPVVYALVHCGQKL